MLYSVVKRDLLYFCKIKAIFLLKATDHSAHVAVESQKCNLIITNILLAKEDLHICGAFLKTMEKVFDATVKTVDFLDPSTIDSVNKWVAQVTKGNITGLIEEGTKSQLFNKKSAVI